MTSKQSLDQIFKDLSKEEQTLHKNEYYQIKAELEFLEILKKYVKFRGYNFTDILKKHHIIGIVANQENYPQQYNKSLSLYVTQRELDAFRNWKDKA